MIAPRWVRRSTLVTVAKDNVQTWSESTGRERRRDVTRAAAYFYLLPVVLMVPFFFVQVGVNNPGPLLSGLAVFTALLFGLLFLVFNLGITIRKDAALFKNAHGVFRLVWDLRASVTYTAVVAVILVVVLVLAVATSDTGAQLAWAWTPFLVWLAAHMLLNLLTVLRRVRTAFNNLTRGPEKAPEDPS